MWYAAGAISNARYSTRWIALQIKAEEEGTPLPVYED